MNRLDFIVTMVSAPFVSIFVSTETYEKTKYMYGITSRITRVLGLDSEFKWEYEIDNVDNVFSTLDEVMVSYKKTKGRDLVKSIIRKHNCVIVELKDTQYTKQFKFVYTNDKALIYKNIQ